MPIMSSPNSSAVFASVKDFSTLLGVILNPKTGSLWTKPVETFLALLMVGAGALGRERSNEAVRIDGLGVLRSP